MTQAEFNKVYQELLDRDCNKSAFSNTSRTLTDSEALCFRDHLWELFSQKIETGFTTDRLTAVLLTTRGKFASVQDEAHAIVARLNQPLTKSTGGGV